MTYTVPQEQKDLIQRQVIEKINLSGDMQDEDVRRTIRTEILEYAREYPMDIASRIDLEREIFNALRKLDILQDLLDDDSVTEIMVNGPENIFVEQQGRVRRVARRFASAERLENIVQQIAGVTNTMINESHPIADTCWKDGSRIHMVVPPVAVDGCMICIRRFPEKPIDMTRLLEIGSLSEEMAIFLKNLVVAGYNIFISGGTGSGKTTFLNALTQFIPAGERVITIEDSAELQVIGVDNLVRLEAREATLDGRLEVPIRELVRTSLRMRPDRIIVGECRGSEALEVLQAANTGHDGTLSTGHANSARDMISRLETMVMMGMGAELPEDAILGQIASGIDIFVHLGRLVDGSRKVLEIAEVLGMEAHKVQLQTIYRFCQDSGGERICGHWARENGLCHRQKLERAGIGAGEETS